ncbi:MAG: prolyl oligopeptidase family serine peptidase [Terriglobales bacterium]
MASQLCSKITRLSLGGIAMVALAVLPAVAQSVYHNPGPMIGALINAPSSFTANVSPRRDKILLYQRVQLPDLSVLAKPMLRLAGLRINPANNGAHAPQRERNWKLVDVASGRERSLDVPASAYAGAAIWSPNGRHFAFLEYAPHTVELLVGDASTGTVQRVGSVAINATMAPSFYRGGGEPGEGPVAWMPDSEHLLVRLVPGQRGDPPREPAVVAGPVVMQALNDPAPVATYEDLLHNQYDAALFTYYATSQLALVDLAGGSVQNVGQPGIFATDAPSPDGRHILVAIEHKPYSYLVNQDQFPRLVEVWNLKGQAEYKLADLPMADHHPILGVAPFPRSFGWEPAVPATLIWMQALDHGNPHDQTRYRDAVKALPAPFHGEALTLARTHTRASGLQWGSAGDLGIVTSRVFRTAMTQTLFFDPRKPGQGTRVAWSINSRAQYDNPGRFVQTTLASGMKAVLENNGSVWLTGVGASPGGDRPFLDRVNLSTLHKQRLFQSPAGQYETVAELLAPDASSFLTERQSATQPPNYFVHGSGGVARQVSHFAEPAAVAAFINSIHARLVKYQRPDGVPLYMYLYLPPNYKAGERDPAVMVGYPLEYTDAQEAGQVTGSPYMYPAFPVSGASSGDTGGPLYLLAAGYVIMDATSMPIVGTPEAVNNQFVPQLLADCKAAISKVTAMGYIDSNRVGVTGHSYGAFMVGNVMANSSLFAAGVAQSGAYNRTLTPFGFQSDRRTFWQAEASYERLSPFFYANKVKQPIILVNGIDDNNTGTFPIQSKRMYMALEGQGATVKWIQLPYEAHIYVGKQSIEEVEWQMLHWFDQYVKNAKPRTGAAVATNSGG